MGLGTTGPPWKGQRDGVLNFETLLAHSACFVPAVCDYLASCVCERHRSRGFAGPWPAQAPTEGARGRRVAAGGAVFYRNLGPRALFMLADCGNCAPVTVEGDCSGPGLQGAPLPGFCGAPPVGSRAAGRGAAIRAHGAHFARFRAGHLGAPTPGATEREHAPAPHACRRLVPAFCGVLGGTGTQKMAAPVLCRRPRCRMVSDFGHSAGLVLAVWGNPRRAL